jgi:hypothetical protein
MEKVTHENAFVGMKVCKGPDWNHSENHHVGVSQYGIITEVCDDIAGWYADVRWKPGGFNYSYRIGAAGKYELSVYDSTTEDLTTLFQEVEKLIEKQERINHETS